MKKYTAEDCFLIWVNLGEDRSIAKLADITGKSEGTLRNYSSKLNWSDRLKEMKQEDKSLIQAVIRDNSNAVLLVESEVYRGVSETILRVLQESLPLLKPTENPRELKTLLDTYKLINGQPTEISRQEVATVSQEAVEALTDEELFSIPDGVLDRLQA